MLLNLITLDLYSNGAIIVDIDAYSGMPSKGSDTLWLVTVSYSNITNFWANDSFLKGHLIIFI